MQRSPSTTMDRHVIVITEPVPGAKPKVLKAETGLDFLSHVSEQTKEAVLDKLQAKPGDEVEFDSTFSRSKLRAALMPAS